MKIPVQQEYIPGRIEFCSTLDARVFLGGYPLLSESQCFVVVSEPVLLDEILPDALNRQGGIKLGNDSAAVECGRRSRGQS